MQTRPALHPVPWLVVVALIFSAAIVLGAAYVSRANISKMSGLTTEIAAAGDLLDAVTRTRSVLHAMETAQRGYLLTGEKEYLAPYLRGEAMIDALLIELKKQSAGKERQLKRAQALDQLVAAKRAEMRGTLQAADAGDRAGALRIVNSKRGLEVMESLLALLSEIRAEELQQRAVLRSLAQEQNWISEVSEFITSAVVLTQLALCYFLLLRYLRQRREAEARLEGVNAGLEEQVRERTEELRDLSRHLMGAREDEKARIARELHDEIGSSLTAVNMDLTSVRQKLGEESPLAARLTRAAGTLRSTVESMRRIIEGLRPTMLESLGLREAVRSWARDYADRLGVPLTIDIPDELPPLPAGSPIGVFRIAQEALTNAMRHAKAKSIRLSLRAVGDELVLEVVDDGTGIGSAMPRKDGKRTSHGLLGIRERALAMGGVCTIGDGPGGRGTEVRVRIPVAKLKAAA
jgi:signal transduction histidine kinase